MFHHKDKIWQLVFTVCFTGFIIFISLHAVKRFMVYENSYPRVNAIEQKRKARLESYNFLMESGAYNMRVGNYDAALTDYELAIDLFPKDSAAHKKLLECTQLLFNTK